MGKDLLIKNGTRHIDILISVCQNRCFCKSLTYMERRGLINEAIRLKYKRRFLLEEWIKRTR